MEKSYNKVELRGNVGQDPKITEINGINAIRFSMATNESYKDKKGEWKEETTWHNIVAWSGKGMPEFDQIQKGSRLSLSGKIRNGRYKTATGEERPFSEILALKIALDE